MKTAWKVTPIVLMAAAAACNTKSIDTDDPSPRISAPVPGPQPTFANVVTAEKSPPAISGGTMTVAKDGRTVIAADPDRDQIYVVDIPTRTVKHTVKLAPGSEPGRVAVDAKGKAHVGLRGSGKLATVDLATGALTEQSVCVAPRGVAYDDQADTVHLACAEGVLVSIPQNGGAIRKVTLDRDLRDVMVTKDKILVSRFRAADVLVLSRATAQLERKTFVKGGGAAWKVLMPPTTEDNTTAPDEPAVVSQDPQNPVGTAGAGYYGSGAADACAAPTITTARLDLPGQETIYIPPAVLPVDLATNGKQWAVVAAGNGHTAALPQVFVYDVKAQALPPGATPGGRPPSSSGGFAGTVRNAICTGMAKGFIPGQATSAVFVPTPAGDDLVVQSREPAALYIMSPDRQHVWKEIPLSAESREDTGHAIFHSNSGGFLACASCHLEGGEDGRTWMFIEGERRTPSMRGTLSHAGPFHWDGSMKDLRHLVDHVFTTRMSGPEMDEPKVAALQNYLFKMPPPPRVEQPAVAVERGATLFRDRGCATCHAGASLTNNETKDVGTGGLFKVPSLVGVGWRAPFLHNGCARTLKDRFGIACSAGDKHGAVTGLDQNQIADLSTYLDSL